MFKRFNWDYSKKDLSVLLIKLQSLALVIFGLMSVGLTIRTISGLFYGSFKAFNGVIGFVLILNCILTLCILGLACKSINEQR